MGAADHNTTSPYRRIKSEPITMLNSTAIKDEYRVLLLEDDSIDCRAILRALKKSLSSFECDSVCLLSEAKELAESKTYDIILTDMNLPDSNGIETVTSLLAIVGKTPIVILSGTDDDTIALEAVHAGAQDFISKRYINDVGLINRTLRHAIERHQLKLGLEKTRDRERFLAHYDQCTSLPNRVLFLDRIQQAVIQARRSGSVFALFFVDLDRFKHVNDSIGHAAGDEVLRLVGARMKSLVRDSDTVARFGGDEFVVILQFSNDHSAMQNLAERMIKEINQPIPYGHHQCAVGASIGVACYPSHAQSPEHLLKNADMAMYEAKKKGRNQVQFFNQNMSEQQSRSFSIEQALQNALRDPDQHFKLHFQPRVNLINGEVRAVEALIRWNDSKIGNIPPDQFIPLAEDLGLIEKIDEWVLRTACEKASQWNSENTVVRIGVNISGRSFNRQDFVKQVVEPQLKEHGISGCALEFEITEGVLLAENQHLLEQLRAIKALGITLAIDDFGTGFSSLNYLNRFPIDTLKIDGSFICDEQSKKSEKALLKAIIALGEALSMNVVAECVETRLQAQYLQSLHCDEGQGYYWCKPILDWRPQKNYLVAGANVKQLLGRQ